MSTSWEEKRKHELYQAYIGELKRLDRHPYLTLQRVDSLTGEQLLGTAEIKQEDGHFLVYSFVVWRDGRKIKSTYVVKSDHRDWFWGPGGHRDDDEPDRRVVVDGVHYCIVDDDPKAPMQGFGGRRHVVEFFDGRRAVTRNLWCQGKVPPKWRDRYPDNARFVPEGGV